jgi:hypothetical protein
MNMNVEVRSRRCTSETTLRRIPDTIHSSHETTLFGRIAATTAVMTAVSDLLRIIVLFLKDRLFQAVFLERVSSIGLYRSSSSLSPIICS